MHADVDGNADLDIRGGDEDTAVLGKIDRPSRDRWQVFSEDQGLLRGYISEQSQRLHKQTNGICCFVIGGKIEFGLQQNWSLAWTLG